MLCKKYRNIKSSDIQKWAKYLKTAPLERVTSMKTILSIWTATIMPSHDPWKDSKEIIVFLQKIVEYRNRLTNRKFIWIWKYWFNPSGEVYRGLGDVPKPTLLIEVKFSLNNQYTFLVTFLRAVFSGYFEPTDVFYIDRNSHNSGSVIKNVWHLYE